MKAVILAGGQGTRISEESILRPKPMVEIGDKPILWHIMKIYSHYGINDFIICLGYKGYLIKEYFVNYLLHVSDVSIDVKNNAIQFHEGKAEPWNITLVNTGEETNTGGRLKRVKKYLDDEDFCFTYGDGVADIDITKLMKFHQAHGKLATVTAVRTPGRFGSIKLEQDNVSSFIEKPVDGDGWINGGFFILKPACIDYVKRDDIAWEKDPLENLSRDSQLMAYRHNGYWQMMDTLRDKKQLESLWESGDAPWKLWK